MLLDEGAHSEKEREREREVRVKGKRKNERVEENGGKELKEVHYLNSVGRPMSAFVSCFLCSGCFKSRKSPGQG